MSEAIHTPSSSHRTPIWQSLPRIQNSNNRIYILQNTYAIQGNTLKLIAIALEGLEVIIGHTFPTGIFLDIFKTCSKANLQIIKVKR